MSVRDVIAAAAGSAGTSKTYIEDVFSTYLYTGNGSTQTINNGIALGDSPETVSFSTPILMSGSTTIAYMNGVAVNSSGLFVAVGYNTSKFPLFATSTNGTTWTTPALMNGSTTIAYMQGVAVNSSGLFVAVGYDVGGLPIFATSTNGSTWTTPARMNNSSVVAYMQGVAVNSSGLFVAVGQNDSSHPLFATSTNGSTWTTPARMNNSSVVANMQRVAVNSSGLFVAIGNNSSNLFVSATSTNGSTWTTPAQKSTTAKMLDVTVNSSGLFVAVGGNVAGNPYSVFSTSTDGSTWTAAATMGGSTNRSSMRSVAVNSSGKFVSVGADGYDYPMFSTSIDGSTWTVPSVINNITTSTFLTSIAANSSGKFVSVGVNGSNYPVFSISTDVPAVTGKGGMVWIKNRNAAENHAIFDTARGVNNYLFSDLTLAQANYGSAYGLTAFNSNGFSVSDPGGFAVDANGTTYASWTFRKAPKFFDVVTYTGDGTFNRQIAHSLGITPGFIIVKKTNTSGDGWITWHRSYPNAYSYQYLNLTEPVDSTLANFWGGSNLPNQSTFYVSSWNAAYTELNQSGATYVAYLFAHDTTADGLIQCGSFTTDASRNASVNLGWEAQYVILKASSTTGDWFICDNMRGTSDTSYASLSPNTSNQEYATSGAYMVNSTSTGFRVGALSPSQTYIYMAIRRGPMRTPTDGTKVFSSLAVNNGLGGTNTIGFPIDTQIARQRNSTYDTWVVDRLRYAPTGTTTQTDIPRLTTTSTSSEMQSSTTGYWDNTSFRTQTLGNVPAIYWSFRRAPGFFDQVCYTGTGAARTVNHNLGVAPELMIVKGRNNANNWYVYLATLGNTQYLRLNLTSAAATESPIGNLWNATNPTNMVFSLGTAATVNSATGTYVAYLFASCPGVSKVGSYTGNGSSQTINCGFTNGARFVLIKRTDYTGDWYVWDTARGIVAATDPHLSLNTTAAEVTTDDTIDPDSTGFIVNQVAATNVNINTATYIYLAIA